MTQSAPNAGYVKMKVARSCFVLISELSSNPATDQVNWDGVIPSESNVDFDHSMNTQVQCLKDHSPMLTQIRTIAALFHISPRTCYEMFPTQREPIQVLVSVA
jgi:hypothetical protein